MNISLLSPLSRKKIQKSLCEKWQSFGIESSNICNANCRFCAYGKNVDKREKGFVSFDTLKYALDLYDKAGGGGFSFSSILGDPLTDRELLEKIKFAKRYKSIKGVSIYTNLINLDNFDIEDFIKSGLTNIAISTSIGDRMTYKRLFGVDVYDRVINNISTLLKINNELNNLIDIKLLIRMDYDFIPKLNDVEEFKVIKKLMMGENIRILKATEWDNYNGVVKISDLPKGAKFKSNIKNKRIPCYALYRKLQILKNGDISICSCRISSELVVDSIFNYRFLFDYWRGEKLNAFRRKWLTGNIPSICRGCTHYEPYTNLMKSALMRNIYLSLRNIKMRFF